MQGGDVRWREGYERARLAWPAVTLDFDRFVAHAQQVGFPLSAASVDPDSANVADLFLACPSGHGDQVAIEALEEKYIATARFSLKLIVTLPASTDNYTLALRAELP